MQKRGEGNPLCNGEGRSQRCRCAAGLKNIQSRFEQAFRGLQERDFQEVKTNRTSDGLKLLGFTFMVVNLRKLNKYTKERQLLTLQKRETEQCTKKKTHI